jgi:hypothetical protein
MVLTCDLVDTPSAGAAIPPGSAWAEVLRLMGADTALTGIADLLRSEIEGAPLSDWRRAAAALGIPLEVADQIGIGPVLDFGDDPQPLGEVFIDGGGVDLTVEPEE